jgi:hypothetical protein
MNNWVFYHDPSWTRVVCVSSGAGAFASLWRDGGQWEPVYLSIRPSSDHVYGERVIATMLLALFEFESQWVTKH